MALKKGISSLMVILILGLTIGNTPQQVMNWIPETKASIDPDESILNNQFLRFSNGAIGAGDAGLTVSLSMSCNIGFISSTTSGLAPTTETGFPSMSYTATWSPAAGGFNPFGIDLYFDPSVPGPVSCSGTFMSPSVGNTALSASGFVGTGPPPTIIFTDPTQEGHDNNGAGVQNSPAFRTACTAPAGETITVLDATLNGGGGSVSVDGGFPTGIGTASANIEYSVNSTATLGQPTGPNEAFPAVNVSFTCTSSGGGTVTLNETFEHTNEASVIQDTPPDVNHVTVGTISNVENLTLRDDDINNLVTITTNSFDPIGYASETSNDTPTVAFGTAQYTYNIPAFYTGLVTINVDTQSEFESVVNRDIEFYVLDSAPSIITNSCAVDGIPCEEVKASQLGTTPIINGQVTVFDADVQNQGANFYVFTVANSNGVTFDAVDLFDPAGVTADGTTYNFSGTIDPATFTPFEHEFNYDSALFGPNGDSTTGDGLISVQIGRNSGGYSGLRFNRNNEPDTFDPNPVGFSDEEPTNFFGSAPNILEEPEDYPLPGNEPERSEEEYRELQEETNDFVESLKEVISFIQAEEEGEDCQYLTKPVSISYNPNEATSSLIGDYDDASDELSPGRITGTAEDSEPFTNFVYGDETSRDDECEDENTVTPEQLAYMLPYINMLYFENPSSAPVSLTGLGSEHRDVYGSVVTPPVYGGTPQVSLEEANAAAEKVFDKLFPAEDQEVSLHGSASGAEYTSQTYRLTPDVSIEEANEAAQAEFNRLFPPEKCDAKKDCIRCNQEDIRYIDTGVCKNNECDYDTGVTRLCENIDVYSEITGKGINRVLRKPKSVPTVCAEKGTRRKLSKHEEYIAVHTGISARTLPVRATGCIPLEQLIGVGDYDDKLVEIMKEHLEGLDDEVFGDTPRSTRAYEKALEDLFGTGTFVDGDSADTLNGIIEVVVKEHLAGTEEYAESLIEELLGNAETGYTQHEELGGKSIKDLIKEFILNLYGDDKKLKKIEDKNDILHNLISNLLGSSLKDDNQQVNEVIVRNGKGYPIGSFIWKYAEADRDRIADAIVKMMKDCIEKIFQAFVEELAERIAGGKSSQINGTSQRDKQNAANDVYDELVEELKENYDMDEAELKEYTQILIAVVKNKAGVEPIPTSKERVDIIIQEDGKSAIRDMTIRKENSNNTYSAISTDTEIRHNEFIEVEITVEVSNSSGEDQAAYVVVDLPDELTIYANREKTENPTDYEKASLASVKMSYTESEKTEGENMESNDGVLKTAVDIDSDGNVIFRNLGPGLHKFTLISKVFSIGDSQFGKEIKISAELNASSAGEKVMTSVLQLNKGIDKSKCTNNSDCVSTCEGRNRVIRTCDTSVNECVRRKIEYCSDSCTANLSLVCTEKGNEYFDESGNEMFDDKGRKLKFTTPI